MTVYEIISIVLAAITVAVGFVSYYFYILNKLQKQIASGIENAETPDSIGEEKMNSVIAALKQLVPTILKPFITDSLIQSLVQAAFDSIEAYAQKQVEKDKAESSNNTEEYVKEAPNENT